MSVVASTRPSQAACNFPEQGAGRVTQVIDVRTIRLADGAEIRLAGVEPAPDDISASVALPQLVDRDVTLHGDADSPDRYGRQSAFVFIDAAAPSIQTQLLASGAVLASGTVSERNCAAELAATEAAARGAKRGIWARDGVIKNAAIPGDILAQLGRFVVVEGRVLSVREAGSTTYLNFGRRWTRDFAVTISRRMMPAFSGAGVALKSLERRRVLVRGWVESRGGPRIEARHVGQIEVVGD
ncbi:thermonuclease family protein [Tardiphaga alba]|uniref:Thermonuclease family protein n=1 Tax=Tardiphaga alba TaxID=340268 RepID=A0ABX8ADL1_9BRAD|nr:thermonuclease family protein [Tardiphaga alba]QUS41851.1 thermonuclease family protein [Tardiphaga alba]